MRRLLTSLVLVAGLGAFVMSTTAAEEETLDARTYWVELDNAFGLIEGADVKVAGVRAGQIKEFEVDPRTYRALVQIEISAKGFGDLRKDVFCESRPQSLIGEYYVDCLPGDDPEKLPEDARIPVKQTASTIPVDLVNNIMRRPYRERFSIILGELGAALTARGEDLNETIRRANPALRETDKVLRVLAEQRAIIRDLTDDADRVVTELADERRHVSRFIEEARDTSRASAERAPEIRQQFQRLPVFLRELRATMPRLGAAAEAQTPALATLADNAPLLERFFNQLGPFSEASRPAFRTLAAAARVGRETVRFARPRVRELRTFSNDLPEVVKNLAITLEHLDDRRFAAEKDERAPGGQGYTGLEALLQYIFRQQQGTNVYDAFAYYLKVSAFLDNACAQYTDAEGAKNPATEYCRAKLGPNQIGINQPDPTKQGGTAAERSRRPRAAADDAAPLATQPGGEARTEEEAAVDLLQELAGGGDQVVPPDVAELLKEVLPGLSGGRPPAPPTDAPLFDFLFGR